jgi:hypothetical protein
VPLWIFFGSGCTESEQLSDIVPLAAARDGLQRLGEREFEWATIRWARRLVVLLLSGTGASRSLVNAPLI